MTADVASLPKSYPVAQVLTVTLFYLNSVSDPVIYVLGYPAAREHFIGFCRAFWRGFCRNVCERVCRYVCDPACSFIRWRGRNQEEETGQDQPRI